MNTWITFGINKQLMKRIIHLFICLAWFANIKAQSKYKPEDLKGFDAKAAWQIAKQKKQNPKEQKEIFESIEKRYIQEHRIVKVNTTSTTINANLKLPNNNSPFNTYCTNVGFEDFNFTNWVGGTWANSTFSDWPTVTPAWSVGIVTLGNNTPIQPYNINFYSPTPDRQTVMTIPPTINNPPNTTSGWDSIAINPITHLSDIPFVSPTGNNSSVRLGNANTGAETEELSYSMAVDAQNNEFTFYYAVVLESGGHPPAEQPFFQVNIFDPTGNPIPGCGSYQINATNAANDSSFYTAADFNTSDSLWEVSFDTIFCKKWTSVSVDLAGYIGQTVTITFRTSDCSLGGHFGYAYIDASCNPVTITSSNTLCAGGSTVLSGPGSMATYSWTGPVTGNTQNLTTNIAGNYTLTTASTSGSCNIPTLYYTLTQTTTTSPIISIQTANDSICSGDTISLTASGANTYTWSNSSTTNSISISPTSNITYTVTGIDTTSGCGNTATQTIYTKTCSVSGINQIKSNNNQVNIYPNPNNGSFVIEPNSTAKQTLQLFDVNGKLVLSQTINGKTNIDASILNEGVYNVSIISNEGVVNKRLVIVR